MLCIYSHPFFNHRCLSFSWKPTLQLAPPSFSGGLRPVHSGRDTREPLSIATQWGAGQQRAEEGLSEVTQDASWSLMAGVILGERGGTSLTQWHCCHWNLGFLCPLEPNKICRDRVWRKQKDGFNHQAGRRENTVGSCLKDPVSPPLGIQGIIQSGLTVRGWR